MNAGSVRVGRVGDISNASGAGRFVLGEAGIGSSITGGTSGNVAIDGLVEALGDDGKRGVSVADSSVAGLDIGGVHPPPLVLAAIQLRFAAS